MTIKQIKKWMKRKGYNQSKLALMMGVNRSMISRQLAGKRKFSKIAQMLLTLLIEEKK
jgi:transcriptional regulator with XRE-family HTH domain